jgi:hypothetical protein
MAHIVMRDCRNPTCTKGKFPSATSRAAYCSSACRLIHHRAIKKTATPTEATPTIRGNTMSTQTPMQFVFSESEYQLLCENAKFAYERHIEVPHTSLSGAIVEFTVKSTIELLEKYHELATAGWTLMADTVHLRSVTVYESPVAQVTRMYMTKPAQDQQKDLEALYAEVKARYEQDLEAKLEIEVERQVQMVVAAKARSEKEAAEQARLKLEQDTRDELAASRAALKAKLIEDGRLTAEGTAQ